MTAFIVVISVLLDGLLGEPKRFHPLVGFGFIATICEATFNRFASSDKHKLISFLLGVFCWVLLVFVPALVIPLLIAILNSPVLSIIFDMVILAIAIGHTSLKQHAFAVLHPLLRGDLSDARKHVANIVSRDTDQLNEVGVRQATIESVLENGSDAIFAPLFWYVIGGLPAVIIYRLANTLDAMWGYKTQRFNYFGRFSARMDDILNWFPSRLVGLSYAVLGHARSSLMCWSQQAKLIDSPSGGVVMSAGAGALQVRLGGACSYHGKIKNKPEFARE
jgi:adenosylcobinamide-phosphate synthase